RPSIQPSCCNPCRNASDSALAYASSAEPTSQPIRRTRSDCCARAANGQAAATPPRRVMTSRRRIATPEAEERAIVTIKSSVQEGVIDVRFGSKADIGASPINVRFTPKSRHSLPRLACPLCANSRHSPSLFDDLVGELQEMHGHIQAQRLGGLEVDNQRYFDWHLNWKVPWLLALEDAANVLCCLGILFGEIRPVGNQAA